MPSWPFAEIALYKLGMYEKALDACDEVLVLTEEIIMTHCAGMNATAILIGAGLLCMVSNVRGAATA